MIILVSDKETDCTQRTVSLNVIKIKNIKCSINILCP